MKLRKRWAVWLVLLAGGMPLVTTGTCTRSVDGYGYRLYSSNDHLLQNALDLIFGEDDD